MQHEDFVTYQQSKRLRDLGFDWNTQKSYNRTGLLSESRAVNRADYRNVPAPTLNQATKWLYREFSLIVVLCVDKFDIVTEETEPGKVFSFCVHDMNFFGYPVSNTEKKFDTPAAAIGAGIEWTLDHIQYKKERENEKESSSCQD